MGSSENFCLRWNDFESNVSGAFRELRNDSDFFDVTLACDNSQGRTLQAHKVILSACSSFFKQMLRNVAMASPGHPNPLLYLRGVSFSNLESVLDFMYHGEVNVAQDDLNSFLAVAEDLQIKGLTQQSTKDLGGVAKKPGRKSTAAASGSAAKRRRQQHSAVAVSEEADLDTDMISGGTVKSEPNYASGVDIASGDASGEVTEEYGDGTGVGTVGIDNFDEAYGSYGGEGSGATAGRGGGAGIIGEDGMEEGIEGDDSKEEHCEDSDGAPAPPSHFTMDGAPVVQEQRRTSGVVPGINDSSNDDGGEETDEILDNLESALIRLAGGRGECGRCGKHFSRVADCRRHLLRSHAVGAHFCGVCLQQFNNAYALQRHAKRANHFVHR